MQKVTLQANATGDHSTVALAEVPSPQPKENWVVVKVLAAPMCTEYKAYRDGATARFLGHEAAGEVIAVAQPCRVKPGDRVVVMPQYPCGACELCVAGDYIHCEHTVNIEQFTGAPEGGATYAQYLLKPDWLLPRIPDDASAERGALACCALGPSFGAFDRMGLSASQTVLITGLGPVGLGAVTNARFRNTRVIAVESHPWRAQRALDMGADCVLDPLDPATPARIREFTRGSGPDCALECSGTVAAQRLCIDSVRRKGQIAFVGECGDPLPLRISPDMIRKGLTLIGSWHYNLSLFPGIMRVIERSPLLDLLVTHRFPMREAQRAFDLQLTGDCGKVILDPWG
jgi:L-iditol 2-dehydrogenase